MSLLGLHSKQLPDFTGRASFVALKKASEQTQNEIHFEMVHLVQLSKVSGSPLAFQKHRPPSGNWKLRWRVKRGVTYSHVLWDDLGEELKSLPVAIRRHYEQLNRRAEELNHLDIMVQHTIKWCAIYLGQQSSRTSPSSDGA
jgi:hypothetical protein